MCTLCQEILPSGFMRGNDKLGSDTQRLDSRSRSKRNLFSVFQSPSRIVAHKNYPPITALVRPLAHPNPFRFLLCLTLFTQHNVVCQQLTKNMTSQNQDQCFSVWI